MNNTPREPQNNVHFAITVRLMVDNALTWEDVTLLLKRHLNDVKFEQDLKERYEPEEWSDWAEGDIV